MKKNFTLKKSLLVAALAFVSVGAQAQFFHVPLWGQLKAYPENGGKVYAEMLNKSNIAPEGNDYAEPAASKDVKFTARVYVGSTTTDIVGNYRAFAVPNDGWVFAGFAVADYVDNEPTPPAAANPKWSKSPQSLAVTSQGYTKESLFDTSDEAFQNFPKEVDLVHYALFTHVIVGTIDYFSANLGTVKIDKVFNDIGQEVTITAMPDEAKKAKFVHWVEESTGKTITENPYTFTVSGADNYKAVFTSENLIAINFPEEGGYVEYYNDNNLIWFPTDVKRANFMKENLKKTGEQAYFGIDNYAESVPAKTPTYFYGKGTQYLFDDVNDKTDDQMYIGTPLELWSGADGVEISTIEITIKIPISKYEDKDSIVGSVSAYLLNAEKEVFERVTEAKVPANRVFLAIPKYFLDQVEEGFVPDVIYLSEEDAEAASVDGVQVDKPVKNGKIYTLDGKQVTSPKQKGVYIYDGKKLIFRK